MLHTVCLVELCPKLAIFNFQSAECNNSTSVRAAVENHVQSLPTGPVDFTVVVTDLGRNIQQVNH